MRSLLGAWRRKRLSKRLIAFYEHVDQFLTTCSEEELAAYKRSQGIKREEETLLRLCLRDHVLLPWNALLAHYAPELPMESQSAIPFKRRKITSFTSSIFRSFL